MMKKIILPIITCICITFFGSCIKNDLKTPDNAPVVEFDATVLNTPATGLLYPVLTRVPGYGRPVYTGAPNTDPAITRNSGVIKFRVNLVGPQMSTAQTINYKVATTPAPYAPAVSGTHFTTTGTAVIPANSNFAEITVTILNPGVSSATPVILVLEITGNDNLKPNNNYKTLGISISQS